VLPLQSVGRAAGTADAAEASHTHSCLRLPLLVNSPNLKVGLPVYGEAAVRRIPDGKAVGISFFASLGRERPVAQLQRPVGRSSERGVARRKGSPQVHHRGRRAQGKEGHEAAEPRA